MKNQPVWVLLCSLLMCCGALASNELDDNVSFSGFGRIVAGYLDTGDAVYSGYENKLSLDQQSLLGLQGDVRLSDSLSFTGQLLAHSADNRASGVEWLYVTYSPTPNLALRVGKQRTPFYNYSDVLDVGFAYPWIAPPRGVYNDYLFSSFEGVNAQYSAVYSDILFSFEGYWGADDSDLVISGTRFKPNVNDLKGLIFKFRGEHISGRFSVNSANVKLSLPQLDGFTRLLNQAGFTESANSLGIDGIGRFYFAGLKYETLDWFIEAEYLATRANVLVIPSIDGTSLTGAYQFNDYTVFATYSTFDSDFAEPTNEIPVGVSPEIDALAFGYTQIFNGLFVDDSRIYSAGVRYDISPSVAVKFSATFIDGEKGKRSFFDSAEDDFNRKATLYRAALEWVF